MRFVMYGAGAIGGVVGAQLHEHGHEVVLIARGAHYDAIRDVGPALRVARTGRSRCPSTSSTRPDRIDFRTRRRRGARDEEPGHRRALTALAAAAPRRARGGVHAERRRQRARRAPLLRVGVRGVRRLPGACTSSPGSVEALRGAASPACSTSGGSRTARTTRGEQIAAALDASTFESVARADIMRWKYRKLINNLEQRGRRAVRARRPRRHARAPASATRRWRASPRPEIESVVARGGRGAGAATGLQWGSAALAVAARVRRRGRAWRGACRSRPTTSTARSCCSAGSTACPRRSTPGSWQLVKQAARDGIAPGTLSARRSDPHGRRRRMSLVAPLRRRPATEARQRRR